MPSEFHVVPNDWEVYALGRTEGEGSARVSKNDADWLRDTGLDRLRGPGAWASYDSPAAVAGDTAAKSMRKPAPAK
jgi:hypothetical protein